MAIPTTGPYGTSLRDQWNRADSNVPISNAWGKDPNAVALEVRDRLVGMVRQGRIPNVLGGYA